MSAREQQPDFYLTMPHACSYLPGREATMLFLDPLYRPRPGIYDVLVDHGFRRSGDFVYRPHCRSCHACLSARIVVADFIPTRGQKRTYKKNDDIVVTASAPGLREEHFALYRRYQSGRHPGGSMDDPDPAKYQEFLTTRYAETVFYEMRLQERLVGVVVTDHLDDGLSAVYTFYDPDLRQRGLGIFAILWQIEHARALGLPWVYLGYWIKESPKMAYKADFHPLEILRDGRWQRLTLSD